ncbi:MAG: hypothetical protein AB1646_22020 [Thermodesulfobacteriota bacterium]
MKEHSPHKWVGVFAAVLVIGLGSAWVHAQTPMSPSDIDLDEMARIGVGLGAAKCREIQQQVDEIMSIFRSGLKDEEKIGKLSQIWSRSAAEMKKSGESDEDIRATVNQYLPFLDMLAAEAQTALKAGETQVSKDKAAQLDRIKLLTQSYVKMIGLLCPKLTLPPIMGK